jgi:hypothetical protein
MEIKSSPHFVQDYKNLPPLLRKRTEPFSGATKDERLSRHLGRKDHQKLSFHISGSRASLHSQKDRHTRYAQMALVFM